MAISESKLKLRTMIPVFELMSAEGRTVNIWDFKGRANMVLAFLPGEPCPRCLDFLTSALDAYHEYEAEKTVLLAIMRGDAGAAAVLRDKLHPPFPILYDESGDVAERYTDMAPAVFVADRFGELYAEWTVGAEGSFPAQREILDVVELINLECPECGAALEWR